jgi:acid phosphatase family membrane protein YuiD
LIDWRQSSTFWIAFGFSFLFRYDAMNIRFEAWKHAHYINSIRTELQSVLDFWSSFSSLKERLWHTPKEVIAWIIFWSILTCIIWWLFYSN